MSTGERDELRTLLIPAVGGQGGGVLSEWIIDAAHADGHVASGTSIPGVAQRTGSTSYYVELFTGAGEPPAFSLYPVPGALDVLLAPELLEVGRAIELGFPSPSRTTIVASTHRLYSIHEKITTGGGVYPTEDLLGAARAFSRRLVALDALALAREHATEPNAVLLGALAASEALPISVDAYRSAIDRRGIQVTTNLAGFELGLARTRAPEEPSSARAAPVAERLDASDPLLTGMPDAVRAIAACAIPRLTDYQDRRYAELYVERLGPFLVAGRDAELAAIVARNLAVWMTYEDAVRVADLKTRLARFERIRQSSRAPGAEIVVTDFLRPDLDEIYGVLPSRLVEPFARWAERRWPHGRPTLGQHVRSTTISGFLRLWLLARLRPLRPISYRARREHARIVRWLRTITRAADRDPELARSVARAAVLVRGYGDVRRRLTGLLDDLLTPVERLLDREPWTAESARHASAFAERFRVLALQGPDGETEAISLARAVLAGAGDRGKVHAS